MPDRIITIRKELEALDTELIELFARRFHLTDQLTLVKTELEKAIEDPDREAEMDAIYEEICLQKGLDPAMVKRIFTKIREEVKTRKN